MHKLKNLAAVFVIGIAGCTTSLEQPAVSSAVTLPAHMTLGDSHLSDFYAFDSDLPQPGKL